MPRDLNDYVVQYQGDYGFERVMVHYRRKLAIRKLMAARPRTVLEIGCGAELMSHDYPTGSDDFVKWAIVEPSHGFAQSALAARVPRTCVIQKEIEVAGEDVLQALGGAPDYVLVCQVLHEAVDPGRLLASVAQMMAAGSRCLIDVPNARSLHRRLALAMAMIRSHDELTARNLSHQQLRVYTMESLRASVEAAGLEIVEAGGNFLKPFTHRQMEIVSDSLEAAGEPIAGILDGLDQLGAAHPEMAAEIYVEARKPAYSPAAKS